MTTSPTTATPLTPSTAPARHRLLVETEQLLQGAFLEETFECAGRAWRLRTLENADEAWVDSRTGGGSIYEIGRSRQAPAVAAALLGFGLVGGETVTVEALWPVPAEMPLEERQALARPGAERAWRREQVLSWLRSDTIPRELVEELYNGYLQLGARRVEVLGRLGPFAISPVTGRASDTSSPGRGS